MSAKLLIQALGMSYAISLSLSRFNSIEVNVLVLGPLEHAIGQGVQRLFLLVQVTEREVEEESTNSSDDGNNGV